MTSRSKQQDVAVQNTVCTREPCEEVAGFPTGHTICCHVPVPMNMPDRGQPVGNRWNSGPTVWANCGHSGPTVGGPWSRAGRPMVSMVESRTAQWSAGRLIYGPWSSQWQQWAGRPTVWVNRGNSRLPFQEQDGQCSSRCQEKVNCGSGVGQPWVN